MRVAVVSPFVDKKHGTERAVAELVERLAASQRHQVELYSQRVEDVDLSGKTLRWRKVASVSGPHLLSFAAWYLLNRSARRSDSVKNGFKFDLVFSPGINCADADAILVHAVFHRLAELRKMPDWSDPRGLHRSLYYGYLCRLERKIYSNRDVKLAAVSEKTAQQLAHYFGRKDVRVIPNGVDTRVFHPAARDKLREHARAHWNFADSDFVALLVGNDWGNKGLGSLLEATAKCDEARMKLLVVGADTDSEWNDVAQRLGIAAQVTFVPPTDNILDCYAAADVLAAPSREDSFNLPVLEAMACGIPAITSTAAGVSSLITHGTDGFVLQNADDSEALAGFLRQLAADKALRSSVGKRAVETASHWTWERAVGELEKFMEDAFKKKYNRIA